MKTININKQEGVKILLFPDNQPHIILDDINQGDSVNVICAIDNSITLINLLQVSNALKNIGAKKISLQIPYLMGARSDRHMVPGDSFDLEVISKLINDCYFKEVVLYDVHSEVSLELIKNSRNVDNYKLVNEYHAYDSILICPDKGARRKVDDYLKWNPNIVDVVYCDKERDLTNGHITLKVLEPEKCKDRNCVVIDDLCDGGGTFLGIASQIKPKYLTLIVTHGVFSKGYYELAKYYDHIIVSNSRSIPSNRIITVVNIINV